MEKKFTIEEILIAVENLNSSKKKSVVKNRENLNTDSNNRYDCDGVRTQVQTM